MVKPEELTRKPQLWSYSPDIWDDGEFCEWEDCVRILCCNREWNSEKDLEHLDVNPYDRDMWHASVTEMRRNFLYWKRKGISEKERNEEYRRKLRKYIREQEQRTQEGRKELDRQMGANWIRLRELYVMTCGRNDLQMDEE